MPLRLQPLRRMPLRLLLLRRVLRLPPRRLRLSP